MSRIKITEEQLNRLNFLILTEQDNITLPRNFEEVPGGNNNWRSNQPSLTQLEYIINTEGIENVVRMNGDADSGGVSKADEKELVEGMGVNYYWVNAHKYNSGDKDKGIGYTKSMEEVLPILEEGNTLIHCTAGMDRTGYMVAKYLQDNFNWDKDRLWEYTVRFNNWESHICNNVSNKGYIKYMEAFYSLEEWCETYDTEGNCKNCRDIVYDKKKKNNNTPTIRVPSSGSKSNDFEKDLDGKLIKRWGKNIKKFVERIQKMLFLLGYDLGIHGVDGKFGPDTEKAVKEFQEGVFTDSEEWDGIVGPNTYEELIVDIDSIASEENMGREDLIDGVDGEDLIDDVEDEEIEGGGSTGNLSRSQYIDLWKNTAIEQMNGYNIPASITLAQGIIESGNGNSRLAKKGNNHFGIKCHSDWNGETIIANDDKPNECFRKYPSANGSFEDHSKFLHKNSRYKSLFDLDITDYEGWAKGLKKAGYATSPTYADTIISVIERNNLTQYDKDIPNVSESSEIKFPSESSSASAPQKVRGTKPHHGYDISAKSNIFRKNGKVPLVVCNNPGTVTYSKWVKGYGNLVEIKHGENDYSAYAHLNSSNVSAGDPINVGDVIGVEGTTGKSSGNHVHFEFRVKRPDGFTNRGGKGSPDVEVNKFEYIRPISDVDDYFYYQVGDNNYV